MQKRRLAVVAAVAVAAAVVWGVMHEPSPPAEALHADAGRHERRPVWRRPIAVPLAHGKPKRPVARKTVAPQPAPALVPESPPAPEAAPAEVVEPVEPVEAPLPPPPLVATEPEALVFGSGNGEVIARAIANAKRAAVQQCFEHELKSNPKLEGRVMVQLDLAPPHTVEAVKVSDDLERPAFTQCVTQAMQHLDFAGLNEDVSINVPYVLSPRGQ
ncbi:MAG: AgmX/PglI C-terminal domain-containing protein [Myxococcaceae bacterium]|nr:AgmX/PglI C-terminal domain-containing protein [Myxococcaceae bacterium]